MLAARGINDVEFVWGDIPAEKRVEIRDAFNEGKFRVFIGSTIFDVGMNVPIASGLVLGGAGDSQTRAPQRVGRILCEAEGKLARCIDIRDLNIKWFDKQAESRMQYYIKRFGDSRVRYMSEEPEVEYIKSSILPGVEMYKNLGW